MFAYQKTNRYFGQLAPGMEDFAREELETLGAKKIKESYHGIFFEADHETLYRITYCTRFFTRIYAPVIRFDCHSTKYLYKTAQQIDWSLFFSVHETFAINANVADSHIRHSRYAALCLKDAIVDQFRDNCGRRPNVETINPDCWINLFIHNNKAVINIDLAGGSLHRRGYRKDAVDAPMQETLAAAMIKASGWNGERPLYDPFCGSGTLLCEALMKVTNTPAGYFRDHFGFEQLPDFDSEAWKKVEREEAADIKPLAKNLIAGSDCDRSAIATARKNLGTFRDGQNVDLSVRRFQDIPELKDVTIVANPPYGIRLGEKEEVAALMKEFGDFLKQRCTGSTAYVYFGDKGMIKKLGLKPEYKMPLRNGGLDGRLCKYDLY
ncbi:class I SAM-dependent RNA methyltransferase [Verrucomicrobiota bacterium]